MRYLIFLVVFICSCGIKKSPDYKIIIDSSDEFLNKNSSVNLAIEGLVNTDFKVIYYLNGKKINSNYENQKLTLSKHFI